MPKDSKLSSLSIFFPFYNDAGTVQQLIADAYETGSKLTNDLEVIAIHGGNSKDHTFSEIKKAKKKFPSLKIVDKIDNKEGYAVIKHGFKAATKDWVFYTDGDAQYNVKKDLPRLVKRQLEKGSDVINGYKTYRKDNMARTFLGNGYSIFSKIIFESPIRDMDCDFRLIRNEIMKEIELTSKNASILPEMIVKLKKAGAKFTEISVEHRERTYGESNYTAFKLLREKLIGDIRLYWQFKRLPLDTFEFIAEQMIISRHPVNKMIKTDDYKVLKFLGVGVSSIIIQFILFNILLVVFGMNAALATIVSDQAAIISSFVLNNKYTFNKNIHDISFGIQWLIRFVKYYAVVIISTLIQAGIVWIGINYLKDNVLIANLFFIIGLIVGTVWNYSLHNTFVWKKMTGEDTK